MSIYLINLPHVTGHPGALRPTESGRSRGVCRAGAGGMGAAGGATDKPGMVPAGGGGSSGSGNGIRVASVAHADLPCIAPQISSCTPVFEDPDWGGWAGGRGVPPPRASSLHLSSLAAVTCPGCARPGIASALSSWLNPVSGADRGGLATPVGDTATPPCSWCPLPPTGAALPAGWGLVLEATMVVALVVLSLSVGALNLALNALLMVVHGVVVLAMEHTYLLAAKVQLHLMGATALTDSSEVHVSHWLRMMGGRLWQQVVRGACQGRPG